MKEEFIIPKRWVVKAVNNDQDYKVADYINKTFGTTIALGLMSNSWCYSNTTILNYTGNDNKHDGAYIDSFTNVVEITYEQFEQYVLNSSIKSVEYDPNDPELQAIYKRLFNL